MTTAQLPTTSSPGWSLALGNLLMIGGVLALIFPVIAAVTAALYLGWTALIAGVIAIVFAIKTKIEPQFGWRLAVGTLYVVLGLLLIANPVAAAASLALLVGALMAASGVVEIVLALRHKPKQGWGWLLASGILAIVFAVLIAVGWPLGSLVLIGYLVGFQIISCGAARIALAMAARKTVPAPAS